MKEKHTIEETLNALWPRLSEEEKHILWGKIEKATAPTPSPFLFSFITVRPMAPLALALILLIGTGGTVAASESARPGDVLFPVDRAVENIRLVFAGEEREVELRARFAAERLEEIRDLLDDDALQNSTTSDDTGTEDDDSDDQSSTSTDDTTATATSSATTTLEIEADVFTDTTIIKVETNGQKTFFETSAETREAVIDAIVAEFGFDQDEVARILDFEVEDRASRPSDRSTGTVSEESEARITLGAALLLDLLEGIDDEDVRDGLLEELLDEMGDARVEIRDDRIRIERDEDRIEIREDDDDDDDETRIEIRDGENRIRIREDDDETRVEIRGDVTSFDTDDMSDEDNRDDSNDDDSSSSDDSSSAFEAEADVFTDVTIVEVEVNDQKFVFETDADTRAEVVAAIVNRFAVDEATVEAVLDFEIENRASRPDDTDEDAADADADSSSNDSDDSNDDSSGDTSSGSDDSSNDDSSTEESDSSDSGSSSDDDASISRLEVRVEGGMADVRLEYGDERDEFETLYTTEAALVTEIALRSGLSEAEIAAALDLEVED